MNVFYPKEFVEEYINYLKTLEVEDKYKDLFEATIKLEEVCRNIDFRECFSEDDSKKIEDYFHSKLK